MDQRIDDQSLKVDAQYVALVGKTFVDAGSDAYKKAKIFSFELVRQNFGIVHGGYIGLMQAFADGANEAIAIAGLSKNLNIGVPAEILDQHDVPRATCVHTQPAKDIVERVRTIIELSDYCVVAELGGFGTLLEAVTVFHMNQLHKKFGGQIRPLIFVGSHWKNLFDTIYASLDMYQQDQGADSTYFVETYEDALTIIKKK